MKGLHNEVYNECGLENNKVRLCTGSPVCPVCEPKHRNSSRDTNRNINIPPVDELLTYITTYYTSSPFDLIKKTILEFYTPDEIKDAKDMLWLHQSEKLPAFEIRRDSLARTAHEANLIDILNGIKKIDSESGELPTFFAANLKRIPTFAPGELDMVDQVERIGEIEHKYQSLERCNNRTIDKLNEVFNVFIELNDTVKGLSKQVQENLENIDKIKNYGNKSNPGNQLPQSNHWSDLFKGLNKNVPKAKDSIKQTKIPDSEPRKLNSETFNQSSQ